MANLSRRTAISAALSCAALPALAQSEDPKTKFMLEAMADIALPKGVSVGAIVPGAGALIVPFADWDYYYVKGQPVVWQAGPKDPYKTVSAPVGFVTDLATIPRAFWSAFPATGRYAYAAIVHDFLYWDQSLPRSDADKLFETAMRDSAVPTTTVFIIANAVSFFGQAYWDANKKARSAGERRILKEFPENLMISWADWRKRPGVFQD